MCLAILPSNQHGRQLKKQHTRVKYKCCLSSWEQLLKTKFDRRKFQNVEIYLLFIYITSFTTVRWILIGVISLKWQILLIHFSFMNIMLKIIIDVLVVVVNFKVTWSLAEFSHWQLYHIFLIWNISSTISSNESTGEIFRRFLIEFIDIFYLFFWLFT